jgi:hypothetical protein
MNSHFKNTILKATQATDLFEIEVIQTGVVSSDYKPWIRLIKRGTPNVGQLTINKITYRLKNSGQYDEVTQFSGTTGKEALYNKKNVKSVNVEIQLNTGRNKGITKRTLRRVIPIPQHGQY